MGENLTNPALDAEENAGGAQYPEVIWEYGTAYDFLVSQYVLQDPEKFGLRPSWAAGVRSRLTAEQRQVLELSQELFGLPVHWIYQLPQPHDAATVLWTLKRMPPAERVAALSFGPEEHRQGFYDLYRRVASAGAYSNEDAEALRVAIRQHEGETPRPKLVTQILEAWARPAEFGGAYVDALEAYYQAFFAEEERHLAPALEESLARSQALAGEMPLPALLERLSQGIRFEQLFATPRLVLAPSYWVTPFVYLGKIDAQISYMVYGGRPEAASLVPGEVVPDALLQALKALSDPTRLRILRYLAEKPTTPSQLTRLLRLRAPTVTHHLNALRLAGLVRLTVSTESKEDRRYETRFEAIDRAFFSLRSFLESSTDKDDTQ